ncbi:MAG: pseudouridine synthase [Christensenellales bacterium]
MRLQKYLAHSGIASRRKAEEYIRKGYVQVNGQTVREMGIVVEKGDIVSFRGEVVKLEDKKYYILYHKPRGEVCTALDPEGRPTVLDKFKDFNVRLYPAGRLDLDSEGLLILTNDGEFAKRVTHPRYGIIKSYIVQTTDVLSKNKIDILRQGVCIDNIKVVPVKLRVLSQNESGQTLLISIGEGRNRQIRRMLESVGTKAKHLKRIQCGKLRLGKLPLGSWRELTEDEINYFFES